jgi:hypothetical protein
LVGTNANGTLLTATIVNSNGVSASFGDGNLFVGADQDLSITADPVFDGMTLSGLPGVLLGTFTDGTVTDIGFTSDNGVVTTYTGASTLLKVNTPQDTRITATPKFANVNVTSFTTASALIASAIDKSLVQVELYGSNGVVIDLYSGDAPIYTLNVGMSQDLSATGSPHFNLPVFVGLFLSPSFNHALLATNSVGRVVASTFASTTGMTQVSTDGVLTTDTPQDLRTTATPQFAGILIPAPSGGIGGAVVVHETYSATVTFTASAVGAGGTTFTATLALERWGTMVVGSIYTAGAGTVQCSAGATVTAPAATIPTRFRAPFLVQLEAFLLDSGSTVRGAVKYLADGSLSLHPALPGSTFTGSTCGVGTSTVHAFNWYCNV